MASSSHGSDDVIVAWQQWRHHLTSPHISRGGALSQPEWGGWTRGVAAGLRAATTEAVLVVQVMPVMRHAPPTHDGPSHPPPTHAL